MAPATGSYRAAVECDEQRRPPPMTGASHEREKHAVSLDLVICTYNHERLLDRTLHAIAAHSVGYPVRWSVLVVDNNCTDGTAEVVARHSRQGRSEEHTSELQSLMRISYAVFCLKKKKKQHDDTQRA